jgi:hypothetical protein
MLPIVRLALVLAASASEPFNVIVTTPEADVAVAPPDPVNPLTSTMAGAPGIPNDDGKVAVMWFPATKAPPGELLLKSTVQVVPVAYATCEEPVKLTVDTDVAPAGRASRVAPKPPASKPNTRATGTNRLKRGEPSCR